MALALGVASVAVAESWVTEYPARAGTTNSACKAEDWQGCAAGLRRLGELTDGRPDFRCKLAAVEARLGEGPAAVEDLSVCVRAGLAPRDPTVDPALEALRVVPAFAALGAEYRRHADPVGAHRLVRSLLDPGLIAEDVAFDPRDGSYLVSSVRERKIVRLAKDGTVTDFITSSDASLWGVYALALDVPRGILWVTTSASAESPPFSAADDGMSALLEFDLRTRGLIGRFELSDGKPHGFGDVFLDVDGTLYVADGRGGGVYATRPHARGPLRPVVEPGLLRSPQTPAGLPDAHRLLVPDYSRGIAAVDLRTGSLGWLPHPPELALFGIDGLYARGRTLVAVQNGTTPERILVMTLDPTCQRITEWRTLVARQAGLGDPTHGTFVGPEFHALVNSGWDRVAADGGLDEGQGAKPAELWALTDIASRSAGNASCRRAPAP